MPSIFDIPAKGQGAQTNMLGTPTTDIPSLIDEISIAEGVDPKLIRAIVQAESGFDPNAKAPTSTASGLMQLVKGTAQQMGVTNVFDPRENLTGGIRYLKQHLEATGGDVPKSLAMYNQGPGGDLSKAQDYVAKVQKFYGGNFSPATQGKPQIDMSSLVSQYGIDPYPANESKPLSIPQIPSISPDTSELYKVVDEGPLGRGFSQALSGPPPQVGKLPFGVENKGGRISQITKDVLYGLPEGVMNLAAGLVGMPAAAIGGTAKAVTSGLAAGGDTFNEIASTAMGHPQTATAQLMMKPFEVIFGGILNSGAEVVKDLNPNATPQELDNKVKATQFVMNLAMVAPMFKGAVKGRGKVDVENPAKSLDTHEVTPEAVEVAKAQVLADPAVAPEVKAQVEGVDVGVLQSIQKKAATSVAKERAQARGIPEVKFPENRSIVEGLLTEVELREGRAKTTMRKAAQIVADYDGDIALADLNGIKGINVKGSTGKAIARLIEERDALKKGEEIRAKGTGDDVPLGDEATVEVVKSLEDIPAKIATAEATMYGKSDKTLPAMDMPLDATSVANLKGVEPESYSRLSSFFDDNSYEPLNEFVKLIKESELEGEVLERMARITGTPVESLTKGAIKVGHGTTKNLVLSLIEEKRRGLLETGDAVPKVDPIPEMVASIDPSLKYDGVMKGISEAGIPDTHNITLTLEDGRQPSFSIAGEVTPEKISAEVQKVREKFASKESSPLTSTSITNWLVEGGETPKITKLYRGVPKDAKDGHTSDYTHVTPFYDVASTAGKGAFGDKSANNIVEFPVQDGHKFYRGGSLAGDPLEHTSIPSARGMEWDTILAKGKELYEQKLEERLTEDRQFYPEISSEHLEAIKKVVADDVTRDIVNAAFEADANNKPGKWADGRPMPESFNSRNPGLRTIEEIAEWDNKGRVEDLPIPEFDSIELAKGEGYTFPDKDRYQSPEKALAKAEELGEGHEVIKVGKTYKVAKYVEEVSYPEFKNEAEANAAGFDILSEIPAHRVKYYQPGEWGTSPVKIGDKYYRTIEFKEMPDKVVPEELTEMVKEKWEDDVSPEDWAALKAFTDEATYNEIVAQDKLKKLAEISRVEEIKSSDFVDVVFSGVVHPDLKSTYATNLPKMAASFAENMQAIGGPNPGKSGEGIVRVYKTSDIKSYGTNNEYILKEDAIPIATLTPEEARLYVKNSNSEFNYTKTKVNSNAALAQAFLEWRDSYVTKCNVGKSTQKSKPITKESLAIVDDNFKTFDSIEAANEWMEATGAVGELIPDPLTGKVSFMNTEKLKGLEELDLYDEGIEQLTGRSERGLEDWDNPDIELSDTGTRDLFDIFNNERGSVDVTPLRVAADAIIDTMEKAKKMGKSVDEYLMHIGADEVAIAAFKGAMAQLPNIQQQIREKDPNLSKILHPEEPLAAPQTVKRNKNKEIVWTMPGITESVAKSLIEAPKDAPYGKTIEFVDPSTGKLSVHFNANSFQRLLNNFRNPIYTLRSAGLGWVRHMERELRSQAKKAEEEWVDWSQSLKSQIDPARLNNYYVASWERMKGAKEALDVMGIKEAAPLNALEIKIKKEIATRLDRMLDQINYSRTRSGQKAIPRLKDLDGNINYLPLIRAVNQLADKGMLEGLTTMPLNKLSQMTNNFKGTFNPHALKRGNSGIPIELDVFAALEKYGTYGFKDIYLSPMAALLHEMATKKLNIPGQKNRISMMEWNPGLGKFLANYSETILGKDPVLAALMAKHEWVGPALHGSDAIGVRMIAAILGGSVRTTVIQPSMYLPNTIGHLNMASAGYGILKFIADIGKGRDSRYWRESSIANLRDYGNDAAYVKELLDRGFLQGARKKAVEISMVPTKIFDHAVAEATWNAGIFHAEKKLKLKGQDAVRFADDFVEMAQGLPTKGSKAPVETSAATRLFTILQSFGIADFNFIASNILGVKNPEANIRSTVFKVIKYTAALQLVGELYKWAGFENVAPDPIGAFQEAQEEGKGMAASLGMGALEFAEKVPILSNIKYGANLGGPVAEMGDMIPEAAKAAINLLDWGHMTEKQRFHQITTAARTIGYWYGIPMTNQILKSIKAAYKGGSPYEVIIGVYEKEKKKKGGLRPNVPRPPQPPRPF